MNDAMERLKRRKTTTEKGYDPLDAIMAPASKSERKEIVEIPVEKLKAFKRHTFKLRPPDSDYMVSLRDSIRENGILEPLLVRPIRGAPAFYEIVAGHTRHYLAKDLGMVTVPCCICDLSDEQAIVRMGESNLQRPDWLPSERALTYKEHLQAIQRSRASEAVEPGSTTAGKSRDIAAQRWGITGKMLDMYVKMADLLPGLLDMVDNGRIAVKGAYALSFMPIDKQEYLLQMMTDNPMLKLTGPDAFDLKNSGWAAFGQILNKSEPSGSLKARCYKFPVPWDQVPKSTKGYLKDPDLQQKIVDLINDYIQEREGLEG